MPQFRLFWAINLPSSLKSKLAAVQEKLKTINADTKWVEEKNLHLTLQFLGDVDASSITTLINNMENALDGFPALHLGLGGLGFFPNLKRPRVLWAGIAGDLSSLQKLSDAVQKANLLAGFPGEEREFRPHLTLARLRSNKGLGALFTAVKDLSGSVTYLGDLNVTSVDLMKSKLSRQGPTYTLLQAVKLRSA